MKILVTGANGFVATHLYPHLTKKGHDIFALVHRHQYAIPKYVTTLTLDDLKTHHFDVVINLAGANIAEKRWTESRKRELFDSRIALTKALRSKLASAPKVLLNASAVGYYGFDESKTFIEDSVANPGFTHDLCAAWENEALAFKALETRTVIFRLAVVLGNGGALEKMRLPFKMGLGGKIGKGSQFFPWIHMQDVCRFVIEAIENESFDGIYNLVAPETVTQAQFAKSFGRALHRPALTYTPECVLKLALGEMSSLLTQGQKVVPEALLKQGFKFKFNRLDEALEDLS